MSARSHVRGPSFRAGLLVAALVAACSSEPSPRGYHSPNVTITDDGLGLVWLHRTGPTELVIFGRTGPDAELRQTHELSTSAWGSDPPLIASDGRDAMVVWTQGRRRNAGLYARVVGPDGPRGPAQAVVESSVTLCPQLVWIGDAYVVGWHEGTELWIGRLGDHGVLDSPPQRLAAGFPIEACRLAWSGRELGVLWSSGDGDSVELTLARVTDGGERVEHVEVPTEAAAVRPIDLTWHDGAWLVAHALADGGGARTVRMEPGRAPSPGPALARDAHVRGLSMVSAVSSQVLGAMWSEARRPRDHKASLYFDVLVPPNGDGPLELATRARTGVNAHARGRAIAMTWSAAKGDETTVSWGILRLREAEGEPTARWGALLVEP